MTALAHADTTDREAGAPPRANADRVAWFEATYRSELAWVQRTVLRLGARERDAEDLVHDVFCAVYRAFDAYDPARPLRPWLFGFAFRVVSDYRRKAAFSRELADDGAMADARPSPVPEPDALVERRERLSLLFAALDSLPLDQRAVFVAVELDEAPVPEVAAALGIPLNTCYSRLRLARARFLAAITRQGPQEAIDP